MTVDEARELLDSIPVADLSYQEWVNVGMALHHEGLPAGLWDDWSRNDRRYKNGECARKWQTFGNGSEIVTMGSVIHMAQQYGWKRKGRVYDWDDQIPDVSLDAVTEGWHRDETITALPPLPDDYDASQDVIDYLSALFQPEDHVCYVTGAYQDDDGKWKPIGGVCSRTRDQLIQSVQKIPERARNQNDLSDAFGTTQEGAGAWICINPCDGKGRQNANITDHRYVLVESDTQDIDTQFALMQDLRLPIVRVIHSGGKSLHAVVRIDAVDKKQYQERVDYLYGVCKKHGLDLDTQDKNASRLTRLPGFRRGDKWQYIVARDIGCGDFVEWQRFIEEEMIPPLPIRSMFDILHDQKPLKDVLIDGVLRCGHKMMIVSSSKAGKTFCLIELALAIASGRPWMGFDVRKGRVLYLNMELDDASFEDRVRRVMQKMELGEEDLTGHLDVVHLRGANETMEKMAPRIVREAAGGKYAAIILDPIYKLGIGDENAAEEVGKFCNGLDVLANTGASVIYAHHHSKGAQGAKTSMDRASGSGVFGRDADAMIDMIELAIPEEAADEVAERYGEDATGWRVEMTLREFPRQPPFNVIFSWPLHIRDDNDILLTAKLAENVRIQQAEREKGGLKGNVGNELAAQKRREKYLAALKRDQERGELRTQKEYAKEFGVEVRTIQRWNEALTGG